MPRATLDANEAAASVAYRLNEIAAIYPITPASPMGEWADEWSASGRRNVWGTVPDVIEMQSEAGAAGAVHGALQGGALATTFTASQGLLLMLPNMYKIAGELTPFVMHVAARTIATHALSIFGDHSDVMACRPTGFAMLASQTVQEAHDMACVAQMATLRARVPFLHFFDGFRTSHEIARAEILSDDDLRALVDVELVDEHRRRALTPDRPVLRGTAQNPDAFFQAREASNPFYEACPEVFERALGRFAQRTGRGYGLFERYGHPEAERVLILMGSGADTARETVERLAADGQRVAVVAVRLYRPFSARHLLAALPPTTRRLAVLDRTKEPGAPAEPLLADVSTALADSGRDVLAVGGRYGLSSKEFTPGMVRAVLTELERDAPRRRFTVGITDDVTNLSLAVDEEIESDRPELFRAVFWGLGSDGTVGANKNTIKIIGEATDHDVQGYFVYDSKKSGAVTISHLRFGPGPVRSHYLVRRANFVACHQPGLLERYDVLATAAPGATLLLNTPWKPEQVWRHLPREVQERILERGLRVYTIDAAAIASEAGLGGRINTIMQVAFFALTDVLPTADALERVRAAVKKTYERKGDEVVRRNLAAIDGALEGLAEVPLAGAEVCGTERPPAVPDEAPEFVQRVTAALMAGHGDALPVSAFPPDGTWPTGTARWEKRGVAPAVPVWDPEVCIQCNKCALVCPHAAIRAKAYPREALAGAPASFRSRAWKGRELPQHEYTIQVAPDDCTGCRLCTVVCPAKDKSNPRHKAIDMRPIGEVVDAERERFEFFLRLPQLQRGDVPKLDVKGSQLMQPLFEFSGACAGCGETPYVKLMTQLFGDRLLVANATGCSSIYGGNLPTTPWTADAAGRGPAWSNSLFEDNAEFGLGFRLAVDALAERARGLLREVAGAVGDELVAAILAGGERGGGGVARQRQHVTRLRDLLPGIDRPEARALEEVADWLVPKSVWLVGGDGWAYDIGYGGLDHVLSLDRDVNVLVLDTEVYSNTGGQASKATPLGAAAKFAAHGKRLEKKDLGLMALAYGHVYVASVAMGAKDLHTVRAFQEAESYDGPSLIIAYSHCIAHGYDLSHGMDQQQRAVDSGTWPLYRYDPRRIEAGEAPLLVDSSGQKLRVADYMRNEARFRVVEKLDPEGFRRYAEGAQLAAERRMAIYRHMAELRLEPAAAGSDGGDA